MADELNAQLMPTHAYHWFRFLNEPLCLNFLRSWSQRYLKRRFCTDNCPKIFSTDGNTHESCPVPNQTWPEIQSWQRWTWTLLDWDTAFTDEKLITEVWKCLCLERLHKNFDFDPDIYHSKGRMHWEDIQCNEYCTSGPRRICILADS